MAFKRTLKKYYGKPSTQERNLNRLRCECTAKGALMFDELHWRAALGVVVPFLNAKHWREESIKCIKEFGL